MQFVTVPEKHDWIDTYQRRKLARAIRRFLSRPLPWLIYGGLVGASVGVGVWVLLLAG